MSITAILKRLFGSSSELPQQSADQPPARRWSSHPWHAVSILPCREACAAALCAVGARYLSTEAPTLPLTGCDARACQCRYQHYGDRRHQFRRAADVWSSGRMYSGHERRGRRGRRATDQA